MGKKRFLAVLSFLLIFLFAAGCTQRPSDHLDPAPVHEAETGTGISKKTAPDDSGGENGPASENATGTEQNKGNQEIKEKGKAGGGPSNILSTMKVHYIDVGQGDSTLIQFSDGDEDYTILIDAGTWQRTDVVEYLQSQKVTTIDLAIATHPDADHIGQMDKVINQFNVGEIWLSGNMSASRTFQRLLEAIDNNNTDYYEPRMGEEFEIGPLQIDVLYPKTITGKNNTESISLKLTYGDVVFIFTGDADRDAELTMLKSGFNLNGDILHIGHHGSNTSTHPSFLQAVTPSIAIYSAAEGNSYGHPHAEVVNLVQSSGIKLYGTDVHGTIIVSTDGKTYTVTTKKSGKVTAGTRSGTAKKPESAAPSPSPSTSPAQAPPSKKEQESKPAPANNNCINLNSASAGELQRIIHIGPDIAKQLIELRPFNSVDELQRINGIGPSRLKDIKSQGLACVGG